MSEAAAPVVENAPATVEAASPADIPKAEETTVSSDHLILLFMLIVAMKEAPKADAAAEQAPATEATPAAEDAAAVPAEAAKEEAKPVSCFSILLCCYQQLQG